MSRPDCCFCDDWMRPTFRQNKDKLNGKISALFHIIYLVINHIRSSLFPYIPKNHTDTHLATMFLEQFKQKKRSHTHIGYSQPNTPISTASLQPWRSITILKDFLGK